ncbi:unnamed protein product [Oikopleura dioica]|uniref:Uncharacterized protein n=1 Tax=Oikopleura dioica TaxID=34765 RepID=E4X0R5_OIKDI|nr:unnamed protein product [Oikopleura dioica]
MENDPPEIDLDFLRYAEDIKESKSLKKFMEYNSRERTRSRPRTPQAKENGPSGDAPSQRNVSKLKKGISNIDQK